MSSEVAVEMFGGRWKRYPVYRDSGVEWLGKVPEGWNTERLKYCATLINEKVDGRESNLQYTGLENIESWTGRLIPSEEISTSEGQSNIYEPEDVLFGKLRPYLAKVLSAKEHGICTGELLVLRPKDVSQEYLFRYMLARDFISIVDSSTYGAKMPRASWDFIGDLPVLLPTEAEQRAIAAFLDSETGRIDTLIEKKERQIKLLQEKRAALISHAVTKGLDPDVPMKDSGVEWLDEVPENWEIKRLKHVCLLIKDGTHQPPSRTSNGIPLLSVRNIVNGKFVNLPDDSLISEEDFNELQRSVEVKKNDILLAIVGATIGKVAIVDEMLPFAIQRSLAVLRPNINIAYYKYFSYFMRSSSFQQLLWKNVGYSAQPGIYLGSLANFNITVPDTNEQRAIASFIDRETGRIDTLTTKVRESVSKLREYRTALISAAVTGKIDVRNKET